MDCIAILAEAVETTTQAAEEGIIPVDLIWEKVTSLGLLESLTFISFGVVCLFYGWRVFKILVMISFALIGLYVGAKTNEVLIGGNGVWLGIISMGLFAFLSVPLMRWGVSILGAARFVIQLQYRPDNSYYARELGRALGAFRWSPTRPYIRLDCPAEAIFALDDAAHIANAWRPAKPAD